MISKKAGIYVISYLRQIYGGHLTLKKDGILRIEIDDQKFYVNLREKDFYDCYTFYRQDGYSVQVKDSDLIHGLFLVYCYSINKEVGLCSSIEDWTRFQIDAQKYGVRKCQY